MIAAVNLNGHAGKVWDQERIALEAHQAIENAECNIREQAVIIGRALNEVHAELGRTKYGQWFKAAMPFSMRTGQVYRSAARLLEKSAASAPFSLQVVGLLSAKGVPEAAIKEVAALNTEDHLVTEKECREIIAKHQPEKPAKPKLTKPQKIVSEIATLSDKEHRLVWESMNRRYKAQPESDFAQREAEIRAEYEAKLESLRQEYEEKLADAQSRPVMQLRQFDPARDVEFPGKLDAPKFKAVWVQWCDYNELRGEPLNALVAEAQLDQLKTRSLDGAVAALKQAMANRELKIPAAQKVQTRFQKPTVEEIREYIEEKNLPFTAEAFFDCYEARGWKIKGNAMKDWKAACRTWSNRRKEEQAAKKRSAMPVNRIMPPPKRTAPPPKPRDYVTESRTG
ncbi:MAG: hypothetical protein NXI32_18155 [bacterium]|nr:hypothetical protein [bacterium]